MFEGSTTNHRFNIPGSLSLVSKHNNNELLQMVRNVWEFDHDVDDHYLPNISQERYLDNSSSNTQSLRGCPNEQAPNNIEAKSPQSDESQQNKKLSYFDATGQTPNIAINSNNKINCSISTNRKYQKSSQVNDQIAGNQQNLENPRRVQEKQYTTRSLECRPQQNRQLEIYSHKYKSNIGYTITQLREILKYNYLASINSELQICRKSIMKLQIQCRKLRIGLRNNGSHHKMLEKKKKHGNSDQQKKCKQRLESRAKTKRKNDRMSSDYLTNQLSLINSKNSARYNKLCQEIASKKKEAQLLGTRQTLTTNYYNVLKARCNQKTFPNKIIQLNQNKQASVTFNPYSLPPQSIVKKERKKNSIFESPSSQFDFELSKYNLNDQQLILLHMRKQIVLISSQTSKEHYQKKINQLEEQIKLMRKHKDVIDHQINSNFCLRKESLQSVQSPLKRWVSKRDYFPAQFFSPKKCASSASLRSFSGYTSNLKKKRSSEDKRMATKGNYSSQETSKNGVQLKTSNSLNKVEPLKQSSFQNQYYNQTPTEQYFISGSLRKIE